MIRLFNDDCLNIFQQLAKDNIKFDMVLTDIPYGTTACKWDTIIPFEQMWDGLNKITKPNTPILLFGTEPFSSHLRMSNIKEYRYDWIWHKNNSSDFALAKKRPMRYHELISVFYRKLPKYHPQFQEYSESTKKRFKQGEKVNRTRELEKSNDKVHGGIALEGTPFDFTRGKYPDCIQDFKIVNNAKGVRLHPTQKPVPLLEYLIKTYTDEDDLVLDFTMGSGSTGVACRKLNRQFVGIELDKNYFNIAVYRIKHYQKE